MPVSKIGWNLYKENLIEKNDIPLNVEQAHKLICTLIGDKKINYKSKKGSSSESYNDAETIISIRNLSHVYENGKKALNDINLDIKRGEFSYNFV